MWFRQIVAKYYFDVHPSNCAAVQYDEAAPASNELATSATALLAKPAADDGARRRYGGGGAAAGAGAAPQGAKKAITVPVRGVWVTADVVFGLSDEKYL